MKGRSGGREGKSYLKKKGVNNNNIANTVSLWLL